jgi:hypothetical protein
VAVVLVLSSMEALAWWAMVAAAAAVVIGVLVPLLAVSISVGRGGNENTRREIQVSVRPKQNTRKSSLVSD